MSTECAVAIPGVGEVAAGDGGRVVEGAERGQSLSSQMTVPLLTVSPGEPVSPVTVPAL